MLTRFSSLLIVLLSASFALNELAANSKGEGKAFDSKTIPTVSFCNLVANPHTFANKQVRVRAHYLENFEWSLLYDPDCDTKDNHVWPIFDCDSEKSCDTIQNALQKNLIGNPLTSRRGYLTMVGELRLAEPGHYFGVQNGLRLGFSIKSIENSEGPVPRLNEVRPSKVDFCELVSNPGSYEGRLVRVTATYFVNFESSVLYDLQCEDKEHFVSTVLDCKDDESCKVLKAALGRNQQGDPFGGYRVEVVVVGRLIGEEEYVRRYGHEIGPKLGFSISRVEQSIRIKRGVPWPGRQNSKRHRTRR